MVILPSHSANAKWMKKHSACRNRRRELHKRLTLAALPPQRRKEIQTCLTHKVSRTIVNDPKNKPLVEETLLSNFQRHGCAASSLTLSYSAVRPTSGRKQKWRWNCHVLTFCETFNIIFTPLWLVHALLHTSKTQVNRSLIE